MRGKIITMAEANVKLAKNHGVVSAGLFLASAADGPEFRQACPASSRGCRTICLVNSGRMRFGDKARRKRSRLMIQDREEFDRLLIEDLDRLQLEAYRRQMKAVFRPNGTSDLRWEQLPVGGKTLMERYPQMQFMDYTKLPGRWELPPNYYLNFSLSESNDELALTELEHGRNVCVVYAVAKDGNLPEQAWGYPVCDGDLNDLRFQDPPGYIVGLRVKGLSGLGNCSGMVRNPFNMERITRTEQWRDLAFPSSRIQQRDD